MMGIPNSQPVIYKKWHGYADNLDTENVKTDRMEKARKPSRSNV